MQIRHRLRHAGASTLALLVAIAGLAAGPVTGHAQAAPAAIGESQWRQQIAAWRAQREKEISAPDGWLTLAGLEWLKPGINSVGSAPESSIHLPASAPAHLGLLTVMGKTVQLLSPPGGFPAGLTTNGNSPREGALDTSNNHPTVIGFQGIELVVLVRGDRFVLRIKDASSPTRAAFHGLNWYPSNPAYRVLGRYIPYHPPQTEKIATVIGTTLNMTAPGVVEFLLNGKVYLLEPVIEGGDKSKLFFILRDTTSQTTTYQAGRFLTTGLPSHGLDKPGHLELDFNKLYNPPCAYTPYATCPLPPEKNRLPAAIQAGEQRFTNQ